MAKTIVTVTLEFDTDAYDKAYGPESEWWAKYGHTQTWSAEQDKYVDVPKIYTPAASWIGGERLVEVLMEGFYDWKYGDGESRDWLKITVDGKTACDHCSSLEGHKDWCEKIAGPEAST